MTRKKPDFYFIFSTLFLLLVLVPAWLVPKTILGPATLCLKFILTFVIPGFYWAGKGFERKTILTMFFGILWGGVFPLWMAYADQNLGFFSLLFIPAAVISFHSGRKSEKEKADPVDLKLPSIPPGRPGFVEALQKIKPKDLDKKGTAPSHHPNPKADWSLKGEKDSYWNTGGLGETVGLTGRVLAIFVFPVLGFLFGLVVSFIFALGVNSDSFAAVIMTGSFGGGITGFIIGVVRLYFF